MSAQANGLGNAARITQSPNGAPLSLACTGSARCFLLAGLGAAPLGLESDMGDLRTQGCACPGLT